MRTKTHTTKTQKQRKVRTYFKREEPIEPFADSLIIENFLPSLRRPRNEKLTEQIKDALYTLKKGESFFIPRTQLHVGTIRKIVLPELTKKDFKDKEIRIVVSKKNELEGCRVGRYI
jgi:hypothetical protein